MATWSLNLTHKEFDVLALLADSQDKVVSRERLMSEVWDENWYGSTKTLDVTIGRLRQKLEAVGDEVRVVTLRGCGLPPGNEPGPRGNLLPLWPPLILTQRSRNFEQR
jgi:DNA-binding response OmpR family regulator